MDIQYALVIMIGIIVGAILVVFLLKALNTNGKMKTQYDERQKLILAKGYKAGFYALVIMMALLMIFSLIEVTIPVDMFMVYTCMMFIGLLILCVVNIWNGAYFGLNNNVRKYCIYFAVLGVINLGIAIIAGVNGGLIVDGKFQSGFVNLACGIMLLVILVTIGLRTLADKREDE